MITELTRRDLIKLLGYEWCGQLTDCEFLSRLYKLEALPSRDRRFATMHEDVVKHTEENDDWEARWVFDDPRLGLDNDERFLRFIAETVHPYVVRDDLDVRFRVDKINTLLMPDGYELFAAGAMHGYGRRTITMPSTTGRVWKRSSAASSSLEHQPALNGLNVSG